MSDDFRRADAHIHLFEGGYHGSLAGRAGVTIDEASLYETYATEFNIARALIIGYCREDWCIDNNAWIARQAQIHPWAAPVAGFVTGSPPDIPALEKLKSAGFVGLSTYIFDDAACGKIRDVDDDFWAWLDAHKWLISVNSKGEWWREWRRIADRFPELRIVVSHLGLPGVPAGPVDRILESVTALAQYPGPYVKMSGFYAVSSQSYDYPHSETWPYVEVLLERFGPDRLLWGSDFSPSLGHVSFPQTLGVLEHMRFLSPADRRMIEGENLLSLIDTIQ